MWLGAKKTLYNILYLNFIVSVSAMFLSGGFTFFLGVDNWCFYALFTGISTMSVYNGQRLFKFQKRNKTAWLFWVERNRKTLWYIVLFLGLFSFLLFLLLFSFELKAGLVFFISVFVSVFYVVKLGNISLREIPHIKIHLIAITWVLIALVFPLINEGSSFSCFYYALPHYFYVLGVTIPFDIRDLKYDSKKQKTIPQLFGVIGAKILAVSCLVFFAFFMCFVDSCFIYNYFFFVAIILQIMLVLYTNKFRSEIYFAGLIDGAISVLGISYFFA